MPGCTARKVSTPTKHRACAQHRSWLGAACHHCLCCSCVRHKRQGCSACFAPPGQQHRTRNMLSVTGTLGTSATGRRTLLLDASSCHNPGTANWCQGLTGAVGGQKHMVMSWTAQGGTVGLPLMKVCRDQDSLRNSRFGVGRCRHWCSQRGQTGRRCSSSQHACSTTPG